MKCSQCEEEARAVCKFCGRAVCNKHFEFKRFVSGFTSFGGLMSFTDNGVEIDDAIWCQRCHPKYRRTI